MTTLDILNDVLVKNNLNWCKGCEAGRSHKRGFVFTKDRTTIHLDSKVSTRSALHRALHEVGHCVNDETGLRSFQCEALAEKFASDTMRNYNIPVPRKSVRQGVAYIQRKKRHGDNIIKGGI